MEVSSELQAPAALPPWKEPRYPLHRRLGGGPRADFDDVEKSSKHVQLYNMLISLTFLTIILRHLCFSYLASHIRILKAVSSPNWIAKNYCRELQLQASKPRCCSRVHSVAYLSRVKLSGPVFTRHSDDYQVSLQYHSWPQKRGLQFKKNELST